MVTFHEIGKLFQVKEKDEIAEDLSTMEFTRIENFSHENFHAETRQKTS